MEAICEKSEYKNLNNLAETLFNQEFITLDENILYINYQMQKLTKFLEKELNTHSEKLEFINSFNRLLWEFSHEEADIKCNLKEYE